MMKDLTDVLVAPRVCKEDGLVGVFLERPFEWLYERDEVEKRSRGQSHDNTRTELSSDDHV